MGGGSRGKMDRVWPAADSSHSICKYSASSSSSGDAHCSKIAGSVDQERRSLAPVLHGQTGSPRTYVRPQARRSALGRMWAWITSKIFIFEVTFGFYGLDWWERCILHMITLLLAWFILYKSSQFTLLCCQGLVRAYKTHESIGLKWYSVNGEIKKLHQL